MYLPPSARFDIATLIAIAQPRRIAFLGNVVDDLVQDYVDQQRVLGTTVTVDHLGVDDLLDRLKAAERFDLAVVCGVLETLPKVDGRKLLAALRDQHSTHYCVFTQFNNNAQTNSWTLADFLSLGLVRVNQYPSKDASSALFKYSIDNYKRTPDWLNADNWANPELWGKYWW